MQIERIPRLLSDKSQLRQYPPIHLFLSIIEPRNRDQHGIPDIKFLLEIIRGIQAHAGRIVREPSEHAARIRPADDRLARRADRMAFLRAAIRVRVD